jgi:dCMP deaminase
MWMYPAPADDDVQGMLGGTGEDEMMTDPPRRPRPGWDRYYLNIARQAATRSNCIRRPVGALVVKQKSIISTGYNGTPIGVRNCFDGGCLRCRSQAPPGEGYDTCVCVHAEQNAIVLAARHGNAVEGGTLYTTLRPCFGCLKEAIQAGIVDVVFEEADSYPEGLETAYQRLAAEAGLILRHFQQ